MYYSYNGTVLAAASAMYIYEFVLPNLAAMHNIWVQIINSNTRLLNPVKTMVLTLYKVREENIKQGKY